MSENLLGEYLRARRDSLRPADAGVVLSGARKVAGLRREEVAVLAGISADYYTRLEQGRERRPSAQVVDTLAHALHLGPESRAHLHRLAGTTPERPPIPATDRVSPGLRQLMDSHPTAPAFVINATLDVLAANTLAKTLHAPFESMDNMARMIFLDPAGRHFYPRWTKAAETAVGHLRLTEGENGYSERLRQLVGTLSAHSTYFTLLWQKHDVHSKTQAAKQIRHPCAGLLSLTYQALDVRDAPGQQLIVYQAEPGSRGALALGRLTTCPSCGGTSGTSAGAVHRPGSFVMPDAGVEKDGCPFRQGRAGWHGGDGCGVPAD
ncbi:helix-turn-helix transcriptional regulator [Streptomyces sp. NPDC058653]|uniref:helix-turn-helix transcriptional regulator n=1 Tax=Streptomyces sp. NPDC058653 TaxID=3346576 RepID=UPI00366559F8